MSEAKGLALDPTRIAIIYKSTSGHTAAVAERIGAGVRTSGLTPEVIPLESAPSSFTAYAGVVVGGSVHDGKHNSALVEYVRLSARSLAALPNAFFSVGLMAANPDARHQKMASGFVADFIDETGWHPDLVALVGGALAYTRYGFVKRELVTSVLQDRDPELAHADYTDWDAVDEFTRHVVAHVRAAAAGAA